MAPQAANQKIVSPIAMTGHSHFTERGYCPPEPSQVQVLTLGDLLPSKRTVLPSQQTRLGFESEGLSLKVWCAGDRTLAQQPTVAIVGTREVSSFGAARARRLAKELSEAGIVVSSGLAKGVDTEALQSAICNNGRVIAVIGTPIDRSYPAENKRLQEKIYEKHLLVSQFHPGQRVYPSHFPERNKLMAALCDATAIIEASDTSGTLHQAAECVRLKRWLFISQAVIEDPQFTWPKKFMGYERFRILSHTSDLISVLDNLAYGPKQY